MKRLLVLLSLIVILFTGCNISSPQNLEPEAEPTPEITEKLTYETLKFEEETDYNIIQVEYPKFSNGGYANEAIEHLVMSSIDAFKDSIDEMGLTPEEIGEDFVGKNGFYIMYEVYYHSEDLISTAFYISEYWSGAAHPMAYTETFNYNLNKEVELGLLDFFVPDTDYASALSATIVPKIKQNLYEDEFAEDEWIEDGAGPEPENFQQFTLTEDGFVFHYDPYIVAPYAAGPQRIDVSFGELYAILLPSWKEEPIN